MNRTSCFGANRVRLLAWLAVCTLGATGLVGCGDDAPIAVGEGGLEDAAGTDDGGLGDLTADASADDATGSTDGSTQGDSLLGDTPDDSGGWTDVDVVIPGDLGVPDATGDVQPDGTTPDVLSCPGAVGCPCTEDKDCPTFSECLAGAAGKFCVEPCQSGTSCPVGSQCITLPGADSTTTDDDKAVCGPKFAHLCDPCVNSSTCPSTGVDKVACIGLGTAATPSEPDGASGWFCANFCTKDADCPSDYTCALANTAEGDTTTFCRPKTNVCTCSPSAIAAQATTSCASGKVSGDTSITGCVGTRTCGAGGLSACSAPVASTETCDNVDNDCNGLTDDTATCDDLNGCTLDTCSGGSCVYTANADSCDDLNACTTADICAAKACAGTAIVCDDSNPCTDDTCDPATGCVFTNHTGTCDDGDTCTTGDACADGKCVGGAASSCTCEQDSDCANYEDGNACNGTLYCNKAALSPVCKVNPLTVVNCDPLGDTFCRVNTCDPGDGVCKYATQNAGATCDDGDVCTAYDLCADASCKGGSPLTCDDGNPCTTDSCDAVLGCVTVANTAGCDDGNACTDADTCATGTCAGQPISCNDSYACTADSCDPVSGCVNAPIADLACQITSTYSEPFNCGSGNLILWQRSDALLDDAWVKWGFDANPNPPAPHSKACSLNLNNGSGMACGNGQATVNATVSTPSIDLEAMTAGTTTLTTFYVTGDWAAGSSATFAVSIDGGDWADAGTLQPSADWVKFSWSSAALAGHKAQFRFTFVGPCGDAAKVGLFVDDFAVFEDLCTTKPGICGANSLCNLDQTGQLDCTTCPGGYEVSGAQCVDVDECTKGTATCGTNATCNNTPGTYTCTCNSGFTGDGASCADVNECTAGTAGCAVTATCANTEGGFTCTCPAGQVGDGKTCGVLGSNAGNAAGSCLLIFQALPASKDGDYWLDFDGPSGPMAPTQYYCNMKDGGWTRLINDNFENSQGGWSAGNTAGCGSYGKLLGGAKQFGKGAATSKTVNAPVHTQALVWMQYIRIDSWDDEYGIVRIDGTQVWAKQGKGNYSWTGNKCGDWTFPEERWDLGNGVLAAHTASTVQVTATSTLDEDADNEAFAVDNVVLLVK